MKIICVIAALFFMMTIVSCGHDQPQRTCPDVPEFSSDNIGEVVITRRSSNAEDINVPEDVVFNFRFNPETTLSFIDERYNIRAINFNISLFNNANALSCVSPKYLEVISYINIVSNVDFDDEHLAGQSLNDLFEVSSRSGTIEEVLYDQPLYNFGFSLVLSSLPTLQKKHNLQIVIELDSGKAFTLEPEELSFQ